MKSGDDHPNLVHNTGVGPILIQIRPIRYTWLVKVMKCWFVISESKEVGVKYGSLYALEQL